MTPDYCLNSCRQYSYFGLLAGNKCYCGNSKPTASRSSWCTTACYGDNNLKCGGTESMEVWKINKIFSVTNDQTAQSNNNSSFLLPVWAIVLIAVGSLLSRSTDRAERVAVLCCVYNFPIRKTVIERVKGQSKSKISQDD
jgi:hypothetical protein